MKNPFSVVKDFEDAVAEYCAAPYCVAINSCTNALFLCLKYAKDNIKDFDLKNEYGRNIETVLIPKHTYISVPMQAMHAGFKVQFMDKNWSGGYNIAPFPIYDFARRFTSKMCEHQKTTNSAEYICVSFHWSKILGIQQGGAILHNDPEFDVWARKARFDGRTEGVAPKDDRIDMLGYHCYMSPEIAAEGLVRLHHLPKHNSDLPNDEYPDLSQMSVFK